MREMVEMKQRSMAEDSQKTLEALKDRYALTVNMKTNGSVVTPADAKG